MMDRIKRAFRTGRSSSQIAGETVGTQLGLGQIEAVESQEFPPEESASDEPEESE